MLWIFFMLFKTLIKYVCPIKRKTTQKNIIIRRIMQICFHHVPCLCLCLLYSTDFHVTLRVFILLCKYSFLCILYLIWKCNFFHFIKDFNISFVPLQTGVEGTYVWRNMRRGRCKDRSLTLLIGISVTLTLMNMILLQQGTNVK